jgi:O-antigen ligase
MSALLTPTTFLILVIAAAIALPLALRMAKDPSLGVVLLAFFLPFERIPSFDIAGFTFKINHFIGGLTFVFWLLAIFFQRRKLSPNPLTIPFVLLFFFFFLSGINAGDQFRQLTVFISILITFVIFIATLNTLDSKKTLQLAIAAILLASGIMGIIGIYQFFGDLAGLPTTVTGLDPGYTKVVFGFPRVHAFSKEPLYFANYLFIPIGVGLALLLSGNNPKEQDKKLTGIAAIADKLRGPWLLPLLILLGLNFILTLSRGAFIAAVPFAIIFTLFYGKKIFMLRNVIVGVLAIAISLSAAYTILESVSPDALDRFIGHAQLEDVLVSKQGESGFGRLNAFGQALEAWGTSPLVGIGLGNFGPYVKYYPLEKPGIGWDIVNNEYLELLAETGILGTGMFFIILIMIFARSVKAYRAAEDEYLKAVLVGLTAALVGIIVQYNFFSTLYIIHIWVLFGLVVGTQNLILAKNKAA